jgi:hypothetical protein
MAGFGGSPVRYVAKCAAAFVVIPSALSAGGGRFDAAEGAAGGEQKDLFRARLDRHRQLNESGVGKRLNAGHVDFP